NLLLNGTDADFNMDVDETVNITGLLVTGEGNITLYQNGTIINSGSSPLENISLYNESGYYNLTLVYYATENYTYSTETHQLIVGPDLIPPTISGLTTSPPSLIINNGSSQEVEVNFTLNEFPVNITFYLFNLSGIIVNSSGPFQIDQSSDTPLNYTIPGDIIDGNYTLNLTATDDSGNSNSTIAANITVDSIAPVINDTITVPPSPFYNNGTAQGIEVYFNSTEYPINITFNLYNLSGSLVNSSGPVQVNSVSSLPLDYTIPGDLADGNYSLNMTASDIADNKNFTHLADFIVDSTKPTINDTYTNPGLPLYNNGTVEDIELYFNVSEYPVNITFYLYNTSGYAVNSSVPLQVNSSSELPLNYTIPGDISDGNYTLNITAVDNAGNYNSTSFGYLVVDTVAPGIYDKLTNPALHLYNNGTVQDIEVYFNSTEYPINITFYLYNDSGALANSSSTYRILSSAGLPVNFTIPGDIADGNYTLNMTAVDNAGNLNMSSFGNFTVDTVSPAIDDIDTDPPVPHANDGSPEDMQIEFSSSEYPINITFYLYNGSGIINASGPTLINSTAQIPLNYTIPALGEGNYTLNMTAVDPAGNVNMTQFGVIQVDKSTPQFISLKTYPNTTDAIDPETTLNVFGNVTDNLTSLDHVLLQYRLNVSSANFTNLTMSYNSSLEMYTASFVLSNGTYIMRLYAVDLAGNSGVSNSINLSSEYENTWTRSPSSFTPLISTINKSVNLGSLVINNTGDFALHFNITSSSAQTVLNTSSSFTLAAKASRIIYVNDSATFGGVKTTTLNITASSDAGTPDPGSAITTGTIIVAPGQPVLIATFTTPSAEEISVTQGDTNIDFTATLSNQGEGNASNVTFFMNIPENWTITFGSQNSTYSQLFSGASETNSITVTIPSNASAGVFDVIANSTASNGSVSLSSLGLIFGDKVQVTVNEPASPLGEESAGEETPPSGPPASVISDEGGGVTQSGGAVGRIDGGDVIYTEQILTVVRGSTEDMKIGLTNLYENSYMENIQIEVIGFLSQYITLSPVVDYSRKVFVETRNLVFRETGLTLQFSFGEK
ncbi:MAG: Ig-like domain repeat protein, partial [Nanoarchaeota archaeon]|nr:Ig-like domain repeat protein [Nanoarchaeota archaeon]